MFFTNYDACVLIDAVLLRKPITLWLKEKLDEGITPGIHWLDRNELTFKVSWVHQSSKHHENAHNNIFQEYALHTGKKNICIFF